MFFDIIFSSFRPFGITSFNKPLGSSLLVADRCVSNYVSE